MFNRLSKWKRLGSIWKCKVPNSITKLTSKTSHNYYVDDVYWDSFVGKNENENENENVNANANINFNMKVNIKGRNMDKECKRKRKKQGKSKQKREKKERVSRFFA